MDKVRLALAARLSSVIVRVVASRAENRDGFVIHDRPDTKAVRCMRDCK